MVVVAVNNANNLESTANANNVRRTAPNKYQFYTPQQTSLDHSPDKSSSSIKSGKNSTRSGGGGGNAVMERAREFEQRASLTDNPNGENSFSSTPRGKQNMNRSMMSHDSAGSNGTNPRSSPSPRGVAATAPFRSSPPKSRNSYGNNNFSSHPLSSPASPLDRNLNETSISMRTGTTAVESYGQSTNSSYQQRSPRSPQQQQQEHTSPQQQGSAGRQQTRNHSNHTQQSSFDSKSKPNPSPGGGAPQPTANPPADNPIVTPELLVDALSGHEDGLLAIAERLMEHYDKGYDAMGEAIIDAFADVQKLFQHVVEAAHMEGAAFEASRREAEVAELRKKVGQSMEGCGIDPYDPAMGGAGGSPLKSSLESGNAPNNPASPTGVSRHDEFIDQDVREVLLDAIRRGQPIRDGGEHVQCYNIYESACNSASALLPVDSDHRGRLQLSIARAESMSPDRACAILRYAMDDVLRSGLNVSAQSILPDPSKRGDCVLKRPTRNRYDSAGGVASGVVGAETAVEQSSEEALASLVEEMKEVLSAPVYVNTPLQPVAERFWVALGEAQRASLKNEEGLEQSLGKLKGDFLLAKMEWEEKLAQAEECAEEYKKKYQQLRGSHTHQYMEQARSAASKLVDSHIHNGDKNGGNDQIFACNARSTTKPESVASFSSGLAQQARSLVGSFSCGGIGASDRNGEAQNVTTPKSAAGGNRRNKTSISPLQKKFTWEQRS